MTNDEGFSSAIYLLIFPYYALKYSVIVYELSAFGKMVIIASMFIGRVGTLTVAFAIGGRLVKQRIRYPEGHTMVG